MDIITGEKFQYLCDIYIGIKEFDVNCHIYNSTLYKHKCVNFNNLTNNELFLSANYIFIWGHVLRNNNFDTFINELQKKQQSFKLIIHNTDDTIDNKYFKIFETTKCYQIFAQNVSFLINEKIKYLPIGIANRQWNHGNKELLNKIIKTNIQKENKIFFNFSINTNVIERTKCYNVFNNKLKFTKYNNQEQYLIELKKCKYCICPIGNGLDCHRLWECLYLNVIPICKKTLFIENINKDFPIHIVNDWTDLNINETLYNNYDNYINMLDKNKLNFNFWKNKIMNKE